MIPSSLLRSRSSPLTTAAQSPFGVRSTTTGRMYWRMLGSPIAVKSKERARPGRSSRRGCCGSPIARLLASAKPTCMVHVPGGSRLRIESDDIRDRDAERLSLRHADEPERRRLGVMTTARLGAAIQTASATSATSAATPMRMGRGVLSMVPSFLPFSPHPNTAQNSDTSKSSRRPWRVTSGPST